MSTDVLPSLLLVIGEPRDETHVQLIIDRIKEGICVWNTEKCSVDLKTELMNFVNSEVPAEHTEGNGSILRSERNIYIEVLICPSVSLFCQALQNFMLITSPYKLILHAGPAYQVSGSWILRDGTFSFHDLARFLYRGELYNVLNNNATTESSSITISCIVEGEWSEAGLKTHDLSKRFQLSVYQNATDAALVGSSNEPEQFDSFARQLVSRHVAYQPLVKLMSDAKIIGTVKFRQPTLYIFPGGQGDACLFGVSGFILLLDGGSQRKPCYWDFLSHLDKIDCVVCSRMSHRAATGINSFFKRLTIGSDSLPKVTHCFMNLPAKVPPPASGLPPKHPLLLSLLDQVHDTSDSLKQLGLQAHPLAASLNPSTKHYEPITLYQKVGLGRLDMFILNPVKDSKELTEFSNNWKRFVAATAAGHGPSFSLKPGVNGLYPIPLSDHCSIAVLLVWHPFNDKERIVRFLYPGSCPQDRLLQGLDKLKYLDFLHHRTCTSATLSRAAGSATTSSTTKRTATTAQHDKRPIDPKQKLTPVPVQKTDDGGLSEPKVVHPAEVPPQKPATTTEPFEKSTAAHDDPLVQQMPPVQNGLAQCANETPPEKDTTTSTCPRQRLTLSPSLSDNEQTPPVGDQKTQRSCGPLPAAPKRDKRSSDLDNHGVALNGNSLQVTTGNEEVKKAPTESLVDIVDIVIEEQKFVPTHHEEASSVPEQVKNSPEIPVDPLSMKPNTIDTGVPPLAELIDLKKQDEKVQNIFKEQSDGLFDDKQPTSTTKSPVDEPPSISPPSPGKNLNPDAPVFVPRILSKGDELTENGTSDFGKLTLEELKKKWGEPIGLPPVQQNGTKAPPAAKPTESKTVGSKPAGTNKPSGQAGDQPTASAHVFKARPAPKRSSAVATSTLSKKSTEASSSVAGMSKSTGNSTNNAEAKSTSQTKQLPTVVKTTGPPVAPAVAKTSVMSKSHPAKISTQQVKSTVSSKLTVTPPVHGVSGSKTTPSSASSAKQRTALSTATSPPFFVDLAYLPHNGNPNYFSSDFVKHIRARYYVLSSLNPSKECLEALLTGKKSWLAPDQELTLIPTYDSDTLSLWMGLKRDELGAENFNVAPSCIRCTLNLEDQASYVCPAYRLEL